MMSDQPFKQGSLRAAAAKAKINQIPATDATTGRMLTIEEKQRLFAQQQQAQQTNSMPANGPKPAQAPLQKHKKGKHPPQPPKGFNYFCGHPADVVALMKSQCKECRVQTQERRRLKKKEKRKAKRERELKEQGLLVESGGPPVLKMGHDFNWRLPPGSLFSNLLYTKEDEEGHKWEGSLIIANEGWLESEEYECLMVLMRKIKTLVGEAIERGLVLKFDNTSSGVMKLLSKLDRQYRRHLDPEKFAKLDEVKKQKELERQLKTFSETLDKATVPSEPNVPLTHPIDEKEVF